MRSRPGYFLSDFDALYKDHRYIALERADWGPREGIEQIILYALRPEDGVWHTGALEHLDDS